jgi:dihydrofolate reductase
MRRIVAFNRVSADGYFAAPDGNLNWVVQDEELDKAAAAELDAASAEGGPDAGTILFGRHTYDMFESFWPHALDHPKTAPDPHHAGRRSRELRAMASFLDAAAKWVFSRTRKDVTWRNSRLVHELDPREIEAIKRQPGRDVMIFGSGSIVSQLTRHGLIDEYQFVVSPLVLGDGRPLVSGVAQALKLELLEAKPYPSGNVKLRYARPS